MYDFSAFWQLQTWISLLTLTFMEIVLGIDNIIFISIVVNLLPRAKQPRGRTIGLLLALVFRIGLLTSISWLAHMRTPLFTLPLATSDGPFGVTGRDLILLVGGLFLLYKSVVELHSKLQGHDDEAAGVGKPGASMLGIIIQIVIIDIVFSFDSILTAVGLVSNVLVMIAAVIFAMGIMLAFSGVVADFVNRNPTIKVLALTFLVMIGGLLLLEAAHQEVPKGYVYFAMFFSMVVELLNMRMRKSVDAAQLRDTQYD